MAIFVAETPAGIAGRLSIARDRHPYSPHVAEVGLMVAADQRRRGIGSALMAEAMKWARSAGITKVELEVFPHNAPAIALYRKLGFEEEGRRRRSLPHRRAPGRCGPDVDPAGLESSAMSFAEIADSFFRPAVQDLVPYEPGKPIEEVQRELGLERVVKLASNEGPYGPFPEALEALRREVEELNRYPDGGAYRLRAALAERHDVRFEEVAHGAGSDGIVDYLSQIALDPGDEIVCGWPSFPSYVIDAKKLGAVARTVPLRDHRYDLDAMLEAIGPRTKLVYVCHPNNPTGTMNTQGRARRVPGPGP